MVLVLASTQHIKVKEQSRGGEKKKEGGKRKRREEKTRQRGTTETNENPSMFYFGPLYELLSYHLHNEFHCDISHVSAHIFKFYIDH